MRLLPPICANLSAGKAGFTSTRGALKLLLLLLLFPATPWKSASTPSTKLGATRQLKPVWPPPMNAPLLPLLLLLAPLRLIALALSVLMFGTDLQPGSPALQGPGKAKRVLPLLLFTHVPPAFT